MTKHQPMECRTSCRNLHVASQISLNFNIKIKTYRFRINHYNSEEVERQLKYWDWKIRLQSSARSSLSYSYVCFRCSQDPPGHTSSGYLCNAFHQEDLRQDGAKKDFQPAPVRCKMDLWPKFLHWFLLLKNSQDSDTCAPVQMEANMQNRNVSKQTHIRLLRRFPPVCYFVTDFRWTTGY